MGLIRGRLSKRGLRLLLSVTVVASIVALLSGGVAIQQYYASKTVVQDETLTVNEQDINASLVAAVDKPTFKLFAPAWRMLGGDANKANVKYFDEIFTNMDPAKVKALAPNAKVYRYTLGPYVTSRYVDCSLIPTEIGASIKENCGKAGADKLPNDAVARQVRNHNLATYAVQFENNFLILPDSPAALEYAKNEATEKVKTYDGILSDSMGVAPLGPGYLVDPVWKEGTSGTYSKLEWLDAQSKLLQAKKTGISDSKSLIFNGLANGNSYFQEDSAKRLFSDAIYGGMAERIFREPHKSVDEWIGEAAWKKDVDMIIDVQSKGKRGYWWSKCWSGGGSLKRDTCLDDPGGDAARDKVRRFVMVSYLMGAGDKSYFSYDVDKCDQGDCDGGADSKSNAAEWYENDYKKAMSLGSASGAYKKVTDKAVYMRTFSGGLALVNPTNDASFVDLGGVKYKDFDGNEVSGSYAMPAHSGMILTTESSDGGSDDTEKPTISLSSPKTDTSVKGVIKIEGTAADNRSVSKVEVLVNNEVVATDSSAPWFSVEWNSSTLSNGSKKLQAIAYDTSGNRQSSDSITINVNNEVAGAPKDPIINSFKADPELATVGERTTLSWSTSNTNSCSVTPDGPTKTTETTWRTPVHDDQGTKTYNLSCSNATGKTTTKAVSVIVKPKADTDKLPSKPSLTSDKKSVVLGGKVTLEWQSERAKSCTLNPGGFTAKSGIGSRVVENIRSEKKFSVTCRNDAGERTSDPLVVKVQANVIKPDLNIVFFRSNQNNFEPGERATLSWQVDGARPNGCRIQPSLMTSVRSSGSWITAKLTDSTTYRLTCVSSNGKVVTQSISVTVSDKIPNPEPRPRQPTILPSSTNKRVYDSVAQRAVSNAESETAVRGLVSLDVSNVLDEKRAGSISYVEYLNDDMKTIDKVTNRPFALDSTKLAKGQYVVYERTVFNDGSESRVAQIINVDNSRSDGDAWWKNPWLWLFATLPLAVAAGVVYLVQARRYDNSIS